MSDIAQKSDFQSTGAFAAFNGIVSGVVKFSDKVLISEGAANARIKKIEMLNAKSDEELAAMDLRREDIIKTVFSDTFDT